VSDGLGGRCSCGGGAGGSEGDSAHRDCAERDAYLIRSSERYPYINDSHRAALYGGHCA